MSITKGYPSVCSCVMLIDSETETVSFETKCETHLNLSDENCLSAIQSLCAAQQEEVPPEEQGE